jgi:hypothetical protein
VSPGVGIIEHIIRALAVGSFYALPEYLVEAEVQDSPREQAFLEDPSSTKEGISLYQHVTP